MASYGKHLRKIRESRGLTQDDLSELSGVAQPTISSWENNRQKPDLASVLRMCAAMQVPIGELVHGLDDSYDLIWPAADEESGGSQGGSPNESGRELLQLRNDKAFLAALALLRSAAARVVALAAAGGSEAGQAPKKQPSGGRRRRAGA